MYTNQYYIEYAKNLINIQWILREPYEFSVKQMKTVYMSGEIEKIEI